MDKRSVDLREPVLAHGRDGHSVSQGGFEGDGQNTSKAMVLTSKYFILIGKWGVPIKIKYFGVKAIDF